ncbi:hypothetical protein [Microvirga splendida]|uniref:Glycosyltransferase RgtA/B/C/D-like domain-containing protein n=1 Tax=Microvirga splendida TaxID=2795727 RepID=A0ABS0XVA3_9HYPH|nr:hypothetical protein [Microvirga splendida]MBJ6123964.1 hypothetical protein [Microvirga splendida]
MNVSKIRPSSLAALVFAVAAICALLLALPGQTITTRYLNDLFIFLDGVHRVSEGQVPNRDFHTALGPLVYYVPALGYWISGHLGGAMPVGMALLVLALAVVAAHIVSSRLRPAIALPFSIFLILVAAVPINLGESIAGLSFGMFYNRTGWAALGFLLILYLRPLHHRPFQNVLDAFCAASLTLLMLYMKFSYGLVALGFLILMLLDSRQWRWALAALALVLTGGLLIESFWDATEAHLNDLLLASGVSGSFKTLDELVSMFLRNLADYTLFALFAALALWRTRSIRDFVFYGFCAGSGFMLIMQNFQVWGIATLPAGAAVAAELLARSAPASVDRRTPALAAGTQLLLLAFVLPGSIHHAATLGLHAALASTGQGQAVPLPRFERVRLVQLWTEDNYPVFSRYLESLGDGAQALSALGAEAGRVHVLDFVGPFSAGLGLAPPRGDSTWHHWGRTINEHHHLPPETLFQDVRVVMEPKWPVEFSTADGLRQIYAGYLSDHYDLEEETKDWKVYLLREPSETVSRSSDDDPKEQETYPSSGG